MFNFVFMSIGKNKLDEILKRAKLLKEVDAWFKVFDSNTKEYLIKLVQNNQLIDKGVDGKGQVIGYYSYATELLTKGRKQQGEHYTLQDTSEFFDSMRVEVSEALLWITGNGSKGNENLYDKYGEWITTLTEENTDKLRQIVKNKYVEYIRKILQIT